MPDHASVTRIIVQVITDEGELIIEPVMTFCDFLSNISNQEYGMELFIPGDNIRSLSPVYLLISVLNLDITESMDENNNDAINLLAFSLFPLFQDSETDLPFNSPDFPGGVKLDFLWFFRHL